MEVETGQQVRAKVLGDVCQALRASDLARSVQDDARSAQATAAETPRPVVDGILVERFISKHAQVQGTAQVVSAHAEVIGAVSDYLGEHGLPREMVMSDSRFLEELDWPRDWRIDRRAAKKEDLVSVTGALCAIAESGTIVFASAQGSPSPNLFLPENHIAVFDAGQVVRHLDDALAMLSPDVFEESRAIHMVTGPSKTADVEQTIQYGAHGPRRLHAIIVDSAR